MSAPAEDYDFFVSYARRDNESGWIFRFIDALQEEQRKFTGGREFRVFFDETEIRSLDDWQHRIYRSLAASRLLVAFISPAYFASEWCRREWRMWIDLEISKHVLSDGAAAICIVEVPWLGAVMSEQEVAAQLAALLAGAAQLPATAAGAVLRMGTQISRRQLTKVMPFYTEGLEALRRKELRRVLEGLARDLDERAARVRDAAQSPNTIPSYNKRFSGRLTELARLRDLLDDDLAGVITSVHGLGGVGKTELAFTYAHAFASLYPGGRYLIPCENRENLRHALLALDEVFRGDISDEVRKTLDTHFAAIHEALRRLTMERGRVLLVLDNVADPAFLSARQTDELAGFGGKLHLLATTRLGPPSGKMGADGGRIEWLTLDALPDSDALELMEKHRAFADEAEKEAATRIVRRLGGFTLAVELVAAYLEQHPEISCVAFLERLGLEELEALEDLGDDPSIELRRKHDEHRLSAVLAPTFASLSSPERSAMEFASLLPPDHVVLPWLRELVATEHPEISEPSPPGHPDPWITLENRLFSLVLLTRNQEDGNDPRIVRCHRLVQDYLKRAAVPTQRDLRRQDIVTLMRQRHASLNTTIRWEQARWELLPMTALAQLWDRSGNPEASWLAVCAAFHWYALGEWTAVEPLIRRALAINEASLGKDHPEIATDLNNLAQLLLATNRLAEAEPLMHRALTIVEASLGKDHPNVAKLLNNLAQLLRATNRLAEAEPLMRRALTIVEASLGEDHPDVATHLSNLAMLLKITNRLAHAEPLMRRVLAIDEASLAEDHPNVATHLNNLAQLLKATHRLAEAEPLMRRALAIDEASFGKDHPNVARDLNNLALLLQITDRLAEAEPLMRRALAIDEASFGYDHPEVATDLNNLAQLLQTTDRLAEAEPLMRRALAIDEASLGKDHPNVARDLNNLATLLQTTNRVAEAEPLMRRALAIDEASLGKDHPNVARDLNNLARLLEATNRLAEAEPLMRRHLFIFLLFTTSTGHPHPHLNAAFLNYVPLCLEMNLPPETIIERCFACCAEAGMEQDEARALLQSVFFGGEKSE